MKKIKVGMLIGEFFDGDLPIYNAKGGYGILARKYIAEHVPCEDIEIETIIGLDPESTEVKTVMVDGSKPVVYLPAKAAMPQGYLARLMYLIWPGYFRNLIWQKKLNEYDVFLSIEMMGIAQRVMRHASKQTLIYYAQDPRPKSDWAEIDSHELTRASEGGRPKPRIAKLMNKLFASGRLVAITQARYLVDKAIDLYDLPANFTASYIPNPVDFEPQPQDSFLRKENKVLFLGRLDAVKRPWLFAEIAKQMPEFEFYMAGQSHEPAMRSLMESYKGIENLHLLGHVEGEQKAQLLKQCKYLVNTSIHEALPVSFLEAMSYGCLIVSNRDPDSLASKFGRAVPQANGDGRESTPIFTQAIRDLESDPSQALQLSNSAIKYVQEVHGLDGFIKSMRDVIRQTAA